MRCKPGILAYINFGPAKGHPVEVRHSSGIDPALGTMWNVASSTPIQTYDSITGRKLKMQTEFDCPDNWLNPISGVPVGEESQEAITT